MIFRVFPDAPRVGDPVNPEYPLKLIRRGHTRSYTTENLTSRSNRKRSYRGYNNEYDGYSDEESSSKKKRTRHSY